MSDAPLATRALRSLDLTDHTDTCTDQAIDALCKKALVRGTTTEVCDLAEIVAKRIH